MKMKKFINAPETITDEELVGLGLAYPDILDVDGHLVISKDLASADRVTIVTYGGSGHEPAQAGFVGKGMLDVQAVGDIFAAPNGQLVFDAMKLADKGHGVLLLTLNYAGDQLAGTRYMLGIRPDFDRLEIDPCIPGDWKEFDVTRVWRGARYDIHVDNAAGVMKGVVEIWLDGEKVSEIPAAEAGSSHQVKVIMGTK